MARCDGEAYMGRRSVTHRLPEQVYPPNPRWAWGASLAFADPLGGDPRDRPARRNLKNHLAGVTHAICPRFQAVHRNKCKKHMVEFKILRRLPRQVPGRWLPGISANRKSAARQAGT